MSVPGSDRVRLDSWKEIAEYLGRDVRTVVRWEKEKGLPVHTVPGLRRRSVFAYADELDSWLAGTPQVIAEAEPADAPAETGVPSEEGGALADAGEDSPDAPQPRELTRNWIESWKDFVLQLRLNPKLLAFVGAAFTVLLVLVYVFSIVLRSTAASSVVEKISLQDGRLVAWNKSGAAVWSYDFPASSPKYQGAVLISHIGENVGEEYLVSVVTQPDNPDAYLLFSSNGRLLWKYAPRDVLQFGKESFSPPWALRAFHNLAFSGDDRVALGLAHHTWWPSVLVVLDRQARPVGRFVNSGWITSIDSFDASKGPLLVAGGASNAHNGGMIAILDANQVDGTSPEEKGSAYECLNCGPGRPVKYFVFPRSELNITTRSTFNFAFGGQRGEQLVVQTNEEEVATLVQPRATAVYEFSRDLQLLRASFSDRYWELHRKLEIEGRIMHTKAECPDRNGPRSVLSWDPQNGWKELHPN